MITSIFLYLDRTYIFQTAGAKSIWDMSLSFYREIIMNDENVKTKTACAIRDRIYNERFGCYYRLAHH